MILLDWMLVVLLELDDLWGIECAGGSWEAVDAFVAGVALVDEAASLAEVVVEIVDASFAAVLVVELVCLFVFEKHVLYRWELDWGMSMETGTASGWVCEYASVGECGALVSLWHKKGLECALE